MSVNQDNIIVHWLDESRSQRIVWLLEELNLEYNLKIYKRNNSRSPEIATTIYPLGKFPIVEIIKHNGEIIKLVETGHIMNYLLKAYDTSNKISGKNDYEKEQVDYFLHYAEGTLHNLLVYLRVTQTTKKNLPIGIKQIFDKVISIPTDQYYKPEILKNLNFLNEILNNHEFFVGNSLTAADIILSFSIYEKIYKDHNNCEILFDEKSFGDNFENLEKWSKVITNVPSFIIAEHKTSEALNNLNIRI